MGKNGVTGVIVPLGSEITNRIFHHHEVYAMAVPSPSTDLAVGDRIFFWDTAGKGLEGEALIEKITFEPAGDLRRYGLDLYLFGEELAVYLTERGLKEDATMLVLKVNEPTKYSKPLRCSLKVGRDGVYVDTEVMAQIMRENL